MKNISTGVKSVDIASTNITTRRSTAYGPSIYMQQETQIMNKFKQIMLKNEENMTEIQQQQRDWVVNYKDVKAFQVKMLGMHDQRKDDIEEELSLENTSTN